MEGYVTLSRFKLRTIQLSIQNLKFLFPVAATFWNPPNWSVTLSPPKQSFRETFWDWKSSKGVNTRAVVWFMELTKRYETLKITCVSKKVLGFGWFSAPSWKWAESGHKKWFLQAANRPNARVLVHWKRFDRYLGSPRHILGLVSVALQSRYEQGFEDSATKIV